jgi:hypothetical protein
MQFTRCVEVAVRLAVSTAEAYAARGTTDVPEPQDVGAALRIWLGPRTIGHFPRSLVERLLDVDHLQKWETLAQEFPWGPPLLWLAGPVQSS